MAKHPFNEPFNKGDDKGADAPFTSSNVDRVESQRETQERLAREQGAAVKPPPVQVASTMPGPVPEGAEPNIGRYDDGKSPSDIGLSDANSGALTSAGLGTVGRIRRVRDVDLVAIEGVNRGDVRERVPFQVKTGESILVPVEDKPGEWVAGEGRDNKAARRL